MRGVAAVALALLVSATSAPSALGAEDAAADAERGAPETITVLLLDCSGSMAGGGRREASMDLLARSAAGRGSATDLVLAVPFSDDHAVAACGAAPWISRVRTVLGPAVAIADEPAALLDWLRAVPPSGPTRLFDTVLAVLPVLDAFPTSDTVLEIVSDGDDNRSRADADDVAEALARVLSSSGEHRTLDVFLRRYERANAGLADRLAALAATSGGLLRVHTDDLEDATPTVTLEISADSLDLAIAPDGRLTGRLDAVVLGGARRPLPFEVRILESAGIETVELRPTELRPGAQAVDVVATLVPGTRAGFFDDVIAYARLEVVAVEARAQIRVRVRIPAGWRRFRGTIVAALAGAGVLVALWLLALLARSLRHDETPRAAASPGAASPREW